MASALGGMYAARLIEPSPVAAPVTAPAAAPAAAPPATSPQVPLDPPAPTPVPPALPAAPPGTTASDVPTIAFPARVQRYSLARDDAAYVGPSLQAPQLYPLARGTPLVSTAQSSDGNWIIALTSDGQAAYVPVAALGPYDPAADPLTRAAAPVTVTGSAQVLTTATLSVAGQQVGLAGVVGVNGTLAGRLQQSILAHGGLVQCVAQPAGQTDQPDQGGLFVCTLPDGVDVARLALFNGAARPAEDASADYRAQAAAAQVARRGLWE